MNRNPVFEEVVRGTVNREVEKSGVSALLLADQMIESLIIQYSAEYFMQDDFTVAILNNYEGTLRYVGVSKRNRTDKMHTLRGRALALSRAVKMFIREFGKAGK